MALMNPPAFRLAEVSKHYPQHRALHQVSLEVPEGVCLALLGHNGAGKTTLMKLLLGLIPATTGEVRVLGADPLRAGLPFRRQLGFLPESVVFHEEMTGQDTLRFYSRLKGTPPAQEAALLERVGLTHAARRRVKTYSKGMRQRLGLAQALLGPPRLLLLDEPTTGLDPVLRQEFFRIIRELNQAGTTVILSSHILTELEARTDLIAILRHGELTAFGTLEALRQEAQLPARLRLSVNGPEVKPRLLAAGATLIDEGAGTLELACPISRRLEVMRLALDMQGAVTDLDLQLPSLDDLYVHYCHAPIEEDDQEEPPCPPS